MRTLLDGLYKGARFLAALNLIAILGLIVMQMAARWTGEVFAGAPNYAGYAMAGASFLAFASAFNHGAHIRVSILLNALNKKYARYLEIWCFLIASSVMWYFSFYAAKFTYWSWKFNDISQGQDKTHLWMPQSLMVLGAVIFAIAITDHFVHLIFHGNHRIIQDDDEPVTIKATAE